MLPGHDSWVLSVAHNPSRCEMSRGDGQLLVLSGWNAGQSASAAGVTRKFEFGILLNGS